MVDTPTTNYGLRTQELGSNIATWGDPNLNEVENCIDQILGKIKDIAITGDYTITSTNYVTTADNKNRGWRFTGTLTALATITVPATHTSFVVVNDTTGGFSLTVKTSAGTGITVPNGRTAWLRCNATNVLNAFPTHMGTTFVPSLAGDPANVSFVETAIANATLPAAAGTVLVSGGDTTAGYLASKLTVGFSTATTTQLAGLLSAQIEIENAGSDEKARILMTPGYVAGYLDGGRQDTAFTASAGYAYSVVSGCTFYLPSAPTNMAKMRIALFNPDANYGINPNGKKINNSTATLSGIPGGQTLEITYDATLGDWE
jgi:hypothetical protein